MLPIQIRLLSIVSALAGVGVGPVTFLSLRIFAASAVLAWFSAAVGTWPPAHVAAIIALARRVGVEVVRRDRRIALTLRHALADVVVRLTAFSSFSVMP